MFDDQYEVLLADTDEARQINYRLRYQVYCLDRRFEPPERFPDGMESDGHDDQAAHFIVRERRTGEWRGATRVILSAPEELPMNQACQFLNNVRQMGAERIMEMSRLLITRPPTPPVPTLYDIKARVTDAEQQRGAGGSDSAILLGLIRAAQRYGLENQFSHMVFLTTPALARILRRLQLDLRQVGAPCEHRGLRAPFLLSLTDGFDQLASQSEPMRSFFESDFAYQSFSSRHRERRYALAS